MIYPTLYKRTSAGKIQIWFAEVENDSYRTTSGQLDGKKKTSEWTIAKEKNVGKVNYMSPQDQATAEVTAMYEKQVKKGYFQNIDEVDNRQGFEPMLATSWKDRKKFIHPDTTVYHQPKLDGFRCIATIDGLFSRKKNQFKSVPHIERALTSMFGYHPDLIIDGELYNHDLKENFPKISSLIRKETPTAEQLAEAEELIEYWVYDFPSIPGSFEERWATGIKILSIYIDFYLPSNRIVLTPTLHCPAHKIDAECARHMSAGFEGGMIRLKGPYENKRSANLIKWKEFLEEEFVIRDIVDGNGNRAGVASSVELETKEGKPFSAGVNGSMEYCKWLLDNKDTFIGQPGTVIFQEYSPDGIPRFTKFKIVRNYE